MRLLLSDLLTTVGVKNIVADEYAFYYVVTSQNAKKRTTGPEACLSPYTDSKINYWRISISNFLLRLNKLLHCKSDHC